MSVTDDYLPKFTLFHDFNESDKGMLSATLRCFDLKPLPVNSFFSMRFSYYWDDGCEYRQIFELVCDDEEFNNCSSKFFTQKKGITNVEVKPVAEPRVRRYCDVLKSINVFTMESIKTESFFEHFDMMQRAGSFSYRFFEVSMDGQKNVFSIEPGPLKEKKYLDLLSSTVELYK